MKQPPRDPGKRDELQTYRQLSLGRTFKSKAQRARAEANGLYRIIGNGDASKPFLQVPRARYEEIRAEVAKSMLQKARAADLGVAPEILLQQMRPSIEDQTYRQLATEQQQAAHLESHFVRQHGRHLTPAEKAQLGSIPVSNSRMPTPAFTPVRQALVDEVISKIQNCQTNNSARYQTAWAQCVGAEVAQQSWLERIDKIQGVAYFRCHNSALSFQLQRQPGLAKRLGNLLGSPLKRLQICR